MTSTPTIVNEAESFLRNWVAEVTRPRDKECLCCYVARLLDEFPCDGSLRHALHYRDVMAPRATALSKRLGSVGGFCDCEIFMNGYQLPGADDGAGGYFDEDEDEDEDDGPLEANAFESAGAADEGLAAQPPLPPCQGVRRGSARPCRNWVRVRRW